MGTAAIVCEFNPFHSGHAHILKMARGLGTDGVISLMSGDYVQRGEPAVCDRFTRTRMALSCGADLVISYPARWSSSPAESYAEAAVRILDGLRAVDFLVFGSECGTIEPILECAEILADEPEPYRRALRAHLMEGMSFPKARAAALPKYAALLYEPNNILAVEYCKALIRTGSSIQPVTFPRMGASHRGGPIMPSIPSGQFASAGEIRRAVLAETSGGAVLAETSDGEGLAKTLGPFMPAPALDLFLRFLSANRPLTLEDFFPLIIEKLYFEENAEFLTRFADVTPDLSRTLMRERTRAGSARSLISLGTSKSLTEAHVRRALLHIALGILKQSADCSSLSGVRESIRTDGLFAEVLGFRSSAGHLVSRVRKKAEIPVVINPAAERGKLKGHLLEAFDEEMRLANLYEALLAAKSGREAVHFLKRPLIKV